MDDTKTGMTRYYSAEGDVRGTCGHRHKTRRTAARCRDRDRAGCSAQGGYSDRYVVMYENGKRYDVDYQHSPNACDDDYEDDC